MLPKYRKRPGANVTAVQLNLDALTFTFQKWGGNQTAKSGDWLLDNDGDVYTVDAESFANTYSPVADQPGQYFKSAEVWAEQAQEAGAIQTKEGSTAYNKGDWLVYNEKDRKDGFAVSNDKFNEMYELA